MVFKSCSFMKLNYEATLSVMGMISGFFNM